MVGFNFEPHPAGGKEGMKGEAEDSLSLSNYVAKSQRSPDFQKLWHFKRFANLAVGEGWDKVRM